MKKSISILVLFILGNQLSAQSDSSIHKFSFEADFRFRIEQDWDSKQADGSFREDRSRLRYRARIGMNYRHNDWASLGLRLRTGDSKKQQDPQVTLGNDNQESGTLPLSLERAFLQMERNQWTLWLGKNTFPFEKSNELFWSDNVFPDGIFIEKSFKIGSNWMDQVELRGGHFILNGNGSSFEKDSYFQGMQIATSWLEGRLSLFPSFYRFGNIADIPDGNGSFLLDYSIFHIGSQLRLSNQPLILVELDYYTNLEDYGVNNAVPDILKNETDGATIALGIGSLKEKGDWNFKFTYTQLQRYAAVDFLAQNDWARWDYSSLGSPDGRLTNLEGFELVAACLIDKDISLTMKYYWVEQLIPTGMEKESNQRIRFDIDIRFNNPSRNKNNVKPKSSVQ